MTRFRARETGPLRRWDTTVVFLVMTNWPSALINGLLMKPVLRAVSMVVGEVPLQTQGRLKPLGFVLDMCGSYLLFFASWHIETTPSATPAA
jgi:hypothetical protein